MSIIPGETLLGKYKIKKWLGQGPFSDAYQVEHITQQITRTLKVLRKSSPNFGTSGSKDIYDRFQLELTLSKTLNSAKFRAHFIQGFDLHQAGDLLALEREYAPGGTLIDLLRKSKAASKYLSLAAVLNLALEVAESLAILHTHNIVYRNLKPSNILFDASRTAKLSDLYLAQVSPELISGISPSQPPFYAKSSYQSPEMKHPRHDIKPPSDVYALGLILFELLTGNSYTELKPNTPLQALRPDIPLWLNELVARMLAKDPENRPWDGAVLAARLRADLEALPDEPQAGASEVCAGDDVVGTTAELPLSIEQQPAQYQDDASLLTTPISIPKASSAKEQIPDWKLLLRMLAMMLRQPAFIALIAVLLVIACWVLYEILLVK